MLHQVSHKYHHIREHITPKGDGNYPNNAPKQIYQKD